MSTDKSTFDPRDVAVRIDAEIFKDGNVTLVSGTILASGGAGEVNETNQMKGAD